MTDLEDALRAVVDTARKWAKTETVGQAEDASEALQDACFRLEELIPKAVVTAVELDRPWREVFEGNEVLAPNGEWYRITSIPPWHEDDGRIKIGMEINGKEGFFPRDPDAKVRVRVNMPDPMETALANLRAGFGEVDVIGR
jgi:hypothetical protein